MIDRPTGSSSPSRYDFDTDAEFRLFAESIENLAWIADADGWIYWYNQTWYRYTGTTPEQLEGWGWKSVHDPTTLPEVLARWQASIATGAPFDMVFPLRGADGRFKPFLTRVIPFKNERGEVIRWFGTNTDVSRELDVTTALRHSEARFRIATEAVNAILWTNNAAGEMIGEQPCWSSFTGQTFDEYQGYGWSAAVHPNDAQPTLDAWERCVRERCLFAFEHRVRRHDGVYRLCSIRALPILDESNEVREWVGVHTDITEERQTQTTLREIVMALKEQQELVEAAQSVSQVGFWRYQPSSRELFLSSGSRHLLGLPQEGEITPEQAVGRVHPEDRAAVQRAFTVSRTSGRYHVEFRILPSDGSEPRWLTAVAHTVASDTGNPYLVGMNLDITQQKRSAETLIRTEKLAAAGRLAASIAHEINNPLEAVTNLLYLLLATPLNPEQRRYATILQSELDRVSQIATHTLRFHRQSTHPGFVNTTDLIESVLALHEGRLRNIEVQVDRRLLATRSVFGFDGDLRQVVANLAGNAIDAMQGIDGPRRLYLRSRNATDWKSSHPGVLITVADTGTGIPPEAFGKIFDAFFTTKADTGTGLGLWVSMEIVNKHRGSLRVRSSASPSGAGSVFQLFIPTEPHPIESR
jgi:two-component system, sporulation sensor kinase E